MPAVPPGAGAVVPVPGVPVPGVRVPGVPVPVVPVPLFPVPVVVAPVVVVSVGSALVMPACVFRTTGTLVDARVVVVTALGSRRGRSPARRLPGGRVPSRCSLFALARRCRVDAASADPGFGGAAAVLLAGRLVVDRLVVGRLVRGARVGGSALRETVGPGAASLVGDTSVVVGALVLRDRVASAARCGVVRRRASACARALARRAGCAGRACGVAAVRTGFRGVCAPRSRSRCGDVRCVAAAASARWLAPPWPPSSRPALTSTSATARARASHPAASRRVAFAACRVALLTAPGASFGTRMAVAFTARPTAAARVLACKADGGPGTAGPQAEEET